LERDKAFNPGFQAGVKDDDDHRALALTLGATRSLLILKHFKGAIKANLFGMLI
jgi:hypothetical protein